MAKKKKIDVLKQATALIKDTGLTDALAEKIEKEKGALGFLLGTLRSRPRTFNPYVMKGFSVYREPVAIDRKTAELVAVAAAAALRCEHCLEAHMERAVQEGASFDEILDTLLICGAISESSTLSVAFRKFKQKEVKMSRKTVRH